MTFHIHLPDSPALRARAEAVNSSVNGALDRLVASLLSTTTHTIHVSRRGMFSTMRHPPYELPRKDRHDRDDGEKA